MLALAMMRVATMLLPPAEMGRISLVLTTTAFFALFMINPVGMFINRRLHAWQDSGVARCYLIRYAGYLLLVAIFAAAILPFLYISGVVNFGVSIAWLIFLVSGSLFFNTINQTAIPSLNMLGDSRMFVSLSVLSVAASFICAIFFVTQEQLLAQYWLFGLLVGQTILALIGCKVLFSRLKNQGISRNKSAICRSHVKVLFSFAWPVAIAAGLGWVQGQGYRYLMSEQLGLMQLGLFVAGYGVSAGILAGFESVLTTYFQPRLYQQVSSNLPGIQAEAWQRYASAVIPSLILTVALIVILAPELTRIFLGENFQSASEYVVWGALAEAARVLMGVYSLIAHVHMRTRWLIFPSAMGAVLSIVLCMLLIPGLGAEGAGVALAIAGFAVVVTMHLLFARQVGGGISTRLVLTVCFAAAVLWIMTLGMRNLLNSTGWWLIFGVLVPVGLAYFGLQYLFLREHLKDKR